MDVRYPRYYSYWNSFNWLGVPLAIIIILCSVLIWTELKENELNHVNQQVHDASGLFLGPIHHTIDDYTKALSRMGKRWTIQNGTPKLIWQTDAENFLNDTRSYEAIFRTDETSTIEWVIPIQDKEYLGINLLEYSKCYSALKVAKETGSPTVSNVLNLLKGPRGFLIIVPLYVKNNFDGYLIANVNANKFFNQIFPHEFETDYGISIYQDNNPVYSNNVAIPDPFLVQQNYLQIYNNTWHIYIWPTANLLNKTLTFLPTVVLGTGLTIAVLVLIIFYFFNEAHINAEKVLLAKSDAERAAERLRRIVETVNEGFITIDETGTIKYINPYAENMLGYRANEILGKDAHKLFIPERFRQMHKDAIAEYVKTGSSDLINKEVEFLAMDREGHEFPVESVVIPLKENTHYSFHSFIRDISARKKAEADLARFFTIVNGSDDAIISADTNGIIATWNHGAEKMYGYKADEVIGKSLAIIYPNNIKSQLQTILETIKQGQHFQDNDTIRQHKDGHLVPISIIVTPVINKKGKVIALSSVTRDITERKEIERMKNEFVAIVSHELRTPLTSIRGSLGLLASEKICSLNEKAKQLLDIAGNNCERLIRLINDILDIEKIESGKMDFKFENFDLGELAKKAIEEMQGLAQKHSIRINLICAEKFEVNADYDKLMQVITNLLSNAIRYSYPNGVVNMRLEHIQDKVRVSIEDNGPGIPFEFQDKIFGKFIQADSSDSRKKSGTGLGLSISKSIIEKHHGFISFLSAPSEGATFYFELKLVNSDLDSKKQEAENQKRIKILICDHQFDAADFLRQMLQTKNIEADIANTAQEAKELLKKNDYSLITLDLLLPDENGISLIREIRENEKTKYIPIFVISLHTKEGKFELNGDGFQVVDWIEKPINKEQSKNIIEYINKHFTDKIPNILSIEDDPDVTKLIGILLQDKAKVWSADTLKKANSLIQQQEFDLIILDLNMPDGYGTSILPCINPITKLQIPVVVFSIDNLEKKYSHLVKEALLKSVTSNEKLYQAILSAINEGKTHG